MAKSLANASSLYVLAQLTCRTTNAWPCLICMNTNAKTNGSVTRCDGQAQIIITDTSSQGANHKVSGEPTPHIHGQIKCSLAQCSNPYQISPTARDFWASFTKSAGGRENWLKGGWRPAKTLA
jgi:hypothetical protein